MSTVANFVALPSHSCTRSATRTGSAFTPSKTFLEFFAGIGLVREGLAPSGCKCVYANDNDANKRQIYETRFGVEHFHEGDVWKTDEVTARIADRPFLATASFPCIEVSLAGKIPRDESGAFLRVLRLRKGGRTTGE